MPLVVVLIPSSTTLISELVSVIVSPPIDKLNDDESNFWLNNSSLKTTTYCLPYVGLSGFITSLKFGLFNGLL